MAKAEQLRLQNDGGQIRAEDFRSRVPFALLVVLFREQPDADARPDTAATTGPLVGRGLRDGLDGEPLKFRARRVPADAGSAGIDDVANARHGE